MSQASFLDLLDVRDAAGRQREAFLREILADPDNDAHRLVYADWLDEYGDEPDQARACFIRTQCKLAKLPEDDVERPDLVVRERALLDAHGREWRESLGRLVPVRWWEGLAPGWPFHRGFAANVTARNWNEFFSQKDRIFAAAPVDGIDFEDLRPGTVTALANSPLLGRLRRLYVQLGQVGDEGVRVLANSQHVDRLIELRLNGGPIRRAMGPAGALALAKSPSLNGLRRLQLKNTRIGSSGLAALVAGPLLHGLVCLDLHNGDGQPTCWRDVAGGLHVAILGGRDEWPNTIGDDGIMALAHSPQMRNLQKLNLYNNAIGDAGARALAASPSLSNLTRLDLRWNNLTVAGAQALLRSEYLRKLRHLLIADDDFGISDRDRLMQQYGERVQFGSVIARDS
jgi:uncharacterized protein (TIGR02996 family)